MREDLAENEGTVRCTMAKRSGPTLRRDPKLTAKTMPPRGTVYAIQLAGGGYGSCRVVETQTPEEATQPYLRAYFVFAIATRWRGDTLPHIGDPELRTVLRTGDGEVAGAWAGSVPPREFQSLGVLPPTQRERRTVRRNYSGWEWLTAVIWDYLPREGHGRAAEARAGGGAMREDDEAAVPQPLVTPTRSRRTLQELATNRLLEEWEEFRPPRLVRQVENVLQDAIAALLTLDSNEGHETKLTIVGKAIERLNALNEATTFIGSIERDDLCEILYGLLQLCGITDGGVFVDAHRTW